MRWLAALGAFAFAYLAIVPAGLVISTVDSACSGSECETSLASDILLGALYAACFVSVAGTATALALYAIRPSLVRERLIRRGLTLALAAVGATLFALFAFAFPAPALFTLGVGGIVYGGLRYRYGPRSAGPPNPSANGHGELRG
ncbi:hypothetical protein BH24ACT23_BH24ACT23_00120 [soil metagenome]